MNEFFLRYVIYLHAQYKIILSMVSECKCYTNWLPSHIPWDSQQLKHHVIYRQAIVIE